jgi:hypothetical protein
MSDHKIQTSFVYRVFRNKKTSMFAVQMTRAGLFFEQTKFNYFKVSLVSSAAMAQGCQIFLDTIYRNERKYTKLPQHYQMDIKYTK